MGWKPEILASRTGGHIVLTVPPVGQTFNIEYLTTPSTPPTKRTTP